MALRTAEQYVTDLKKLQKEIYMFGEKLDDWTEHPIIKASINAQKVGFELAQLEEFQDVLLSSFKNGEHAVPLGKGYGIPGQHFTGRFSNFNKTSREKRS